MNNEQRKRLEADILNKRIVDYGNYQIIYNIATGVISIYRNSRCIIKKANTKEVIAFFEKKESNRIKRLCRKESTVKTIDYCRERNLKYD